MPSATARRSDIQWPKHPVFGNPLPPIWPSEPSLTHLESITRHYLNIPTDAPCIIEPFAEGGFNKIYSVSTPSHPHAQPYLIRVALPVEPRLKTLSEAATIDFVRAHATELVPRVLAYSADAESSALEYEWMIMGKSPGDVLKEHWDAMDWDAKVELVKTIVGVLAKLHANPLRGIGNVYPDCSSSTPSPGRIVSMMFFWDNHYEQDVSRGPFRSSHDWLHSCLNFTLNDAAKILARPAVEADSDDEEEREEARLTQALAERLVRLLPRVFPQTDAAESTAIHHDDLSFHNLLVNDSGKLTGIVDWECVSALPLWRVCTMPSFLNGRTRTERPDVRTYGRDEDGEITEFYAEHLLEWEQTQLRAAFLEEMKRVQPEWVRTYRDKTSVLKNDFFDAMLECDSEICRGRVRRWVEQVEGMLDEEISDAGYTLLHDETTV
ncbi:kinase-like protein [Peniophora sp. CONT]|nr:kinase-like protein [Peniophora sp. CONT]